MYQNTCINVRTLNHLCCFHALKVRVEGAESNRKVMLVGQNNYYSPYDVMVRVGNRKGLGPEGPSVPIMSAEDSMCQYFSPIIALQLIYHVQILGQPIHRHDVTYCIVPKNIFLLDTRKKILCLYNISIFKNDLLEFVLMIEG